MGTSAKIIFFAFLQFVLSSVYTHSLSAQLVSDFRVNDDTTSSSQLVGKVGIDSSGNYVMVWQDQRYIAPTVFVQRFNFLNQPQGENFKVNPNTDTSHTPCINVNDNGNFEIAWTDRGKIVTRMFDNKGVPKTGIVLVSESNYSNTIPKIDSDRNRNFIIAWENYLPSFGESIFFQRFTFAGNKLGSNQNVSDVGVNSRKSNPSITVRQDGSFIICWQDNRLEPSTYDIFMQMYDSSGNKIGNNVRVNEVTSDTQDYPKICSDTSGNFVVAWDDFRFSPNVISVCQFYDHSGQKIGNNLLIAQNTVVPIFSSRDNGDIAAGIYAGSSPAMQRIKSDRTLWGSSFIISNQALSSTKYITDIQIYKDRVVNVWQDNRNGNFDIYCNIRSYNNPDTIVSVNQISAVIPRNCRLFQNYPNPFNPVTKIPFQVNKASHVEIKVYDNLGREIRSLLSKKLQPGIYETEFDSKDLYSGVYYYKMISENFYESKRMIIVK